jgi:immune inhibitor A
VNVFILARVAVVLVQFSDKTMGDGAKKRFEDLFFSTGTISTGSVTEYYQDVSGGKISITGEVVGPFRMPRTMKQYANNASGMGGAEPNARTMATDALNAANSSIDFRPYDNDGNGFVDAFIVVHAGSGAEMDRDKNKIWSLKWTLPSVHTVDGVKVYGFLTVPEDARLGVCAHELGHLVFGWPDLYDIDRSSKGIGDWCLMSGGSWGGNPSGDRPCHPSAYCKSKQQWVVESIDNTNRQITLRDVKTPGGRQIHRLWTNGNAFGNEYFLIENRQRTGFDESLPGSGLLSKYYRALF